MNIGDLFLRILADDSTFKAELAQKAAAAGDEAGATLGQRMGAAIKTNGVKIIGGALALAGGIAIKGMLELQHIVADFRAETGATAEEADRAGKAILAMSGHNIQPMDEIAKSLTKVYAELHLTGDEAAATTQKFLTFGRATGQNAADAVTLFADILHAWNLTADQSGVIMDALVVSHQRYGGAITDNEAALAALAPALQAANQTWRDGLALLNLFRESGIDSAVAVTAMTKALAKVHTPEQLQALIADISATEDPFLRAAKATDLFGAKAGPKLAQVLKPGTGGLQDYAVSADDAAGASQRAADVLDNTWGARFQLLIKAAGAAIISFGNDWSGIAQVAGTAASAFAALGGGKIVEPLIGAFKGAWAKIAASSVVTSAVAAVADKWSTLLLKGMFAADAVEGAIGGAWKRIAATSLGQAVIAGAASGKAFALAYAASVVAVPLILVPVAQGVQDQNAKNLHDVLTKALNTGTDAAIADAQTHLDQMERGARASHNDSWLNIILGERAAFDQGLRDRVEGIKDAGQFMVGATASVATAAESLNTKGTAAFVGLGASAAQLRANVIANANAIKEAITTLTTKLVAEAQALITGYYEPMINADDLRVQKDTIATDKIAVNAARAALAKTKAGSTERVQAQLTLDQAIAAQHQSLQALDTTRLNLMAAGKLSAKEQAAWLADLQKKYRTSTGAAKADIGDLIDKIHELQKVPTTVVRIIAALENRTSKTQIIPRATGGPVVAGQPYLVNERTPNSEVWIPDVSGRVVSGAVPAAAVTPAGGTGGDHRTITIYNPEPHAAAEDIGRMMRRLAALGL